MATINKYELHPNLGSVWNRAVNLWAQYVIDDTWTFAFTNTSHNVGFATLEVLQITINDGTDDNVYWLILNDTYTILPHKPPLCITNQSGFYSTPPILAATYGTRTTLADADTNLKGMRELIWTTWTESGINVAQSFNGLSNLTGSSCTVWTRTVYSGMQMVADWNSCQVANLSSAIQIYNGNDLMSGAGHAAILVAGPQPAPLDITPVVDALEDIASVDVTYTANNGGAVWSMRGKVNAE